VNFLNRGLEQLAFDRERLFALQLLAVIEEARNRRVPVSHSFPRFCSMLEVIRIGKPKSSSKEWTDISSLSLLVNSCLRRSRRLRTTLGLIPAHILVWKKKRQQ